MPGDAANDVSLDDEAFDMNVLAGVVLNGYRLASRLAGRLQDGSPMDRLAFLRREHIVPELPKRCEQPVR